MIRTASLALVVMLGAVSQAVAHRTSARTSATVYVRGYTRADGSYVAPYSRSAPSSSTAQFDDWPSFGGSPPVIPQPDPQGDALTAAPPPADPPGKQASHLLSNTPTVVINHPSLVLNLPSGRRTAALPQTDELPSAYTSMGSIEFAIVLVVVCAGLCWLVWITWPR